MAKKQKYKKILYCSLSLPILYLCSLVTVWFLSQFFFSVPITCVFSLPSPPSWWDKVLVLGLAWAMSSAVSSPFTSLEAGDSFAPRPTYKYHQRARGHLPPPNSHFAFAMNNSASRSCRWRRLKPTMTSSRQPRVHTSKAEGSYTIKR